MNLAVSKTGQISERQISLSVTNFDDDFAKCATGEVLKSLYRLVKAINPFDYGFDIMFIEEWIHPLKRGTWCNRDAPDCRLAEN